LGVIRTAVDMNDKSRVNLLVKIPIRFWDINKTRQGITFICRTLYLLCLLCAFNVSVIYLQYSE